MNFYIKKINVYLMESYNFLVKYKSIILFGIFISIFVNAVDIFTIKFGVDAERYSVANTSIYYRESRFGSMLLYYLFPFARYHILSQITGIIALTFAALLTISRHNIPYYAKLLFVILFVTYPYFAFLQYFYFQSAYNFLALLLTVIAYRIIELNKNILLHILSIILLFIGISSYQANLSIFCTVLMINVIIDYLNDRNSKDILILIVKSIFILFISLTVYYITVKLNSGLTGYYSSFIAYNKGFLYGAEKVYTLIINTILSKGYFGSHTANIVATIILAMISVYFLMKSYKIRRYRFVIFLIILWILSMFTLNILLGNEIRIRSNLAIAYYPAFIILLTILLFDNINLNILCKLFCGFISIILIIFHSYSIVKNQTSYYLNYQSDVINATIIMEKIYNKYPEVFNGKYKVTFFGSINKARHPYMTSGRERMNYSQYSLHRYYNIYRFFQIHGFPMNIKMVSGGGENH